MMVMFLPWSCDDFRCFISFRNFFCHFFLAVVISLFCHHNQHMQRASALKGLRPAFPRGADLARLGRGLAIFLVLAKYGLELLGVSARDFGPCIHRTYANNWL